MVLIFFSPGSQMVDFSKMLPILWSSTHLRIRFHMVPFLDLGPNFYLISKHLLGKKIRSSSEFGVLSRSKSGNALSVIDLKHLKALELRLPQSPSVSVTM